MYEFLPEHRVLNSRGVGPRATNKCIAYKANLKKDYLLLAVAERDFLKKC
jgi:hypothetical protein